MAITVAFDGTRHNDAEALGSVWTDIGGGKCALEPDFVYQNTRAVSEKVGTSEGGVALDLATGVDFTTPRVWICKHIATNNSALNNKGSTGGILEIGSGGRRSAYDRYYVVGGDTYPIKGGWLVTPIDANGGNQSARPGTAPTLTAIDYFGWACDFNATSKAENVAMDAVDSIVNGTGLTLTGNTPDGDFEDFRFADEGTAANRWGIVTSQEGILYVTGVLTIGTATETDFTDTGQVIVFPDAEFLNTVGFFGLDIGLQNANTVIAITDCVFKGRGSTAGTVDTRPDYGCTGTSGAATYTGITFDVFREFVMTSGMTVDGCKFLNGDKVTQALGTITDCDFSGSTAGDGDGYLDANDDISGCTFAFSDGHAIEWVGSATDSMAITDCTFTSYGADATNDAAFYNPNTSGTLTLNLTNTTGLTVRTASGGTTIVNNAVSVTVTVKALSDSSNIENARVLLEAASGGAAPSYDTVSITASGTTASVSHTAHGMADGDLVIIRQVDQEDYNGVFAITNVTTNAYDYTMGGSPSSPATSTSTITATRGYINKLTDASGIATETVDFGATQPVQGWVRKAGSSPYYQQGDLIGSIVSGDGYSQTVLMVLDEEKA